MWIYCLIVLKQRSRGVICILFISSDADGEADSMCVPFVVQVTRHVNAVGTHNVCNVARRRSEGGGWGGSLEVPPALAESK